MSTLETFFWAFLSAFIGAFTGLSAAWLTRRSAPNGYPPFVFRKSFTELAAFDQKQQWQLLHEANKMAGWRSFVPILFCSLLFSLVAGFGKVLPNVISIPSSRWIGIVVVMICAGAAAWFSSLLSVRCLRPFLKKVLEARPPIRG